MALMALTALVLVLACANVASLLLARARYGGARLPCGWLSERGGDESSASF